jgi:DnaK suppressor protein
VSNVERVAQELRAERDRLVAERRRLERELLDPDSDVSDHAVPAEPEEQIEEAVDDVVRQINDALARIADGTYGTCESCGATISPQRLEALPYATLCISCAERGGR